MPAYRMVWVEIAERQYLDLSDSARDLVDRLLTKLEQTPTDLPGAVFDEPSDQWSASFGDLGFVLYAVVLDGGHGDHPADHPPARGRPHLRVSSPGRSSTVRGPRQDRGNRRRQNGKPAGQRPL